MRMSRATTGRCALQLALLVGGLLALGFLCGEQAQAAEGTPSPMSAVRQQATATPTRKPVTEAAPAERLVPAVHGVHKAVGSVTDPTASTVTRSLGAVAQQVSELPAKVPSLPTEPVVQVPELPIVSGLPGKLLPAPVTSAPHPAKPRTPVRHDAGHEKSRTKAVANAVESSGPQLTVVTPGAVQVKHAGGHRAARAVDAPTHPAPTGDPDGALGKAAVDDAACRHGDAHAVTFADRAPLRLVTGAFTDADAAGIRDRYRGIPLFPG
ncbi:hypothetical protein ABZ357_26665 [Streptomyces sp. NPDC005917]|uniref:hypothetical protein n=1 Tax=unclassified Streptomyces TaxID=2593676 RepID=UPI0033E85A68